MAGPRERITSHPEARWRCRRTSTAAVRDWVELRGFDGTPLAFQRVEGYRPPQWPGQESPQQVHLDFDVDDIEADERRVLELGATLLERADQVRQEANWRVYADPAGHPFCLCAH
ncbi:VOC family protein [Promicromonospora sp. CA-289599]|uniref:VOC family protein n=1 Tax=Promicromonospora sp. CA-289599 TaxID=3240014 RepID=UPI003D93A2EB